MGSISVKVSDSGGTGSTQHTANTNNIPDPPILTLLLLGTVLVKNAVFGEGTGDKGSAGGGGTDDTKSSSTPLPTYSLIAWYWVSRCCAVENELFRDVERELEGRLEWATIDARFAFSNCLEFLINRRRMWIDAVRTSVASNNAKRSRMM